MRSITEKPFRNRKEIKKEIRKCNLVGGIVLDVGIIFAIIGVIGDALNITLVLESTSWLLLAVFFGLVSLVPYMHSIMAKHLFGIESESKNK